MMLWTSCEIPPFAMHQAHRRACLTGVAKYTPAALASSPTPQITTAVSAKALLGFHNTRLLCDPWSW